MNKHMSVFLHLTLYKELFGQRDDTVTSHIIRDIMEIPVPKEGHMEIRKQPPSTKELVLELLELGFSPTWVAAYLDISKASVSYHVHAEPPKRPYVNRYLDRLEYRHKNNSENNGVTIN